MEFLSKKQKIILVIILGIMILSVCYYIMNKINKYDYSEIEEMEDSIENIDNEKTSLEAIKEISDEYIVLHITGAVVNQGIVEIEKGARILDAIEAAGGITEEADLSKVNLAYKVEDGQKIYIPNINEKENTEIEYITEDSGENIIIETDKEKVEEKVNINMASQTELETLTGIGPSTALKIINYRRENGEFKEIEDIKNVSGIGDAKFEAIKEQICVD